MVWEWDYDYNNLSFTTAARRRGEKVIQFDGTFVEYVAELAALDIETSKTPDGSQSFMYVWQFAIEETCIMGRTWEQLRRLLTHIKYKLHGRRLLTFVHNLSFEGQFLSGIYEFEDREVFAMDSRKLLKMAPEKWGLELRCSYRLTQLSLDQFTRRYNVQHQKLSGEDYDYDKRRYPDTSLTEREIAYCENDVLGLVEAIHALMKLYDDNVYTLPLTSTGFVRREVKRAARPDYHLIKSCWPSYDVYKLLRAAFRGGNVHASRFYAGQIMENVKSRDIASSYPSQQVNKLFPMSPFIECHGNTLRYLDRTLDQGYAVLLDVRLYGVSLRRYYTPVPYIPIAKCAELSEYQGDNGRVLRCRSCRIALTDIDWKIVDKQYKIEKVEIVAMYRARYGSLPDGIVETNKRYFRDKTRLKGVEGQELYYAKSKELLNAIYGMSVQDPVKAKILFANNQYLLSTEKTEQELLELKGKQPYTCYQWGVWTTAHARASLEAGIDLCGDGLIYVDTDSCKYVGEVDWSNYNKERIAECELSGGYADDPAGRRHYLGVYEDDGSYLRFCTLGAKKYAFETQSDEGPKLGVTISGVSKKKGAADLAAHGGLEAFAAAGQEDGCYIFRDSGKTESRYTDYNTGVVDFDGHKVNIVKNVVITDKEYTLSVTDNYVSLLQYSAKTLSKVHEHWLNCTSR